MKCFIPYVQFKLGVSNKAFVTLPKNKYTKVTPVNLRGEIIGKPTMIVDGKFALEFKAYAPTSIILE